MSKIIVDELETQTQNGNVRVVPNGTGVLEVRGAGGDDAMLQLNCSAQSHGVKLKSPAHTSGQSYTMMLPDNQIAADKFLKVKSITGSGATAVGQLEYADAGDATKMPLTGGTFTGSVSFETGLLQESFDDYQATISGTHNHDVLTHGTVWYGSAGGSTSSWVFNIRGNSTTTFDSIATIGKTTTISIFCGVTSTTTYMTAFQIDGVNQTIKWAGGSAPTASTGGGVDVYTITLFRISARNFNAFGNFTNFA